MDHLLVADVTVTVPHFSMPLRFVAGQAVVVEQDSTDEITDCVANICRYRTGDRPEKPDFGIPDPTFAVNGPNPALLAATVMLQEPRAEIAAAADGSNLEQLVSTIAMTVTDKGGSS